MGIPRILQLLYKLQAKINVFLLCFFQEKQPFERIEVSRKQALEMFSDNKFKVNSYSNIFCIFNGLIFATHLIFLF